MGEERAAMFSVLQTAWHRLGTILTDAPNLEEAMILGGLNFEVEKRKNLSRVPDQCGMCLGVGQREAFSQACAACGGTGVTEIVTEASDFTVWRTDRWEPLGTVGSVWHPLQNSTAFKVLEPLLEDGLATIETGGSLRGGRDVWMLFKLAQEKIMDLAGSDELSRLFAEVEPYALITNNHAGQRKVVVRETPVRVVCANTLAASLNGAGHSIEVEHTKNVKAKLEEAAAALFGNIVERYTQFANLQGELQSFELPERAFTKLVLDPVVPIEHLFRKIQRKECTGHTETAHRKASEKRGRIRQLWDDGEGHTGDHSAWEAWNGMIQALDHDDMFDRRNRLQSMYDGDINKSKVRVASSLLTFAGADADARSAMLN